MPSDKVKLGIVVEKDKDGYYVASVPEFTRLSHSGKNS